MVEATRQHLWQRARRRLWRSFVAALIVGSIGGAATMFLWTLLLFTSREPTSNALLSALVVIPYGVFFGPVLWIPVWGVAAVAGLGWVWITGDLNPRTARYVFALLAGVVLFASITIATDPSGFPIPIRLMASVLGAVGVWTAVPWILKPPRES